jgi:maltooligosyltrehalose trehalohydrolase
MDAVFSTPRPGGVDGAVLSASAFVLRFFTPDHRDDRLLIVNLGADLDRASFAEPLLAPPADSDWVLNWSTEDPAYGGGGTPDLFPDGWWHLPAESALVLTPGPRRPRHPVPRVGRRG